MHSLIARRAARNTAARRCAAIGWKVGSLAAALALCASLPSQAAVVYSASGVVSSCVGGGCWVDAPISRAVVADGTFTLSFTTQSPVLDTSYFFYGGFSEDYYSNGQYLFGNDTFSPQHDVGKGQIAGDASTITFTNYTTVSSPPCEDAWIADCTIVRVDKSYLDEAEVDLGGATAGESWSLTISTAPEPAEWMLLIAGLALLGASIRARTSQIRGPRTQWNTSLQPPGSVRS